MTRPGRPPKPSLLRLVTGTHRRDRHGDRSEARDLAEIADASLSKPVMPKGMKGEAAKAWARYIAPAFWLDAGREAAAIAFCELWQEFRDNPRGFPAARHSQMRAYSNLLGLADDRNRGGFNGKMAAKNAEPKDEFFD